MTDTLIFSTTDPEGRVICLRTKALDHIKQEHPELKTKTQEIRSTIERPDVITETSTRQSLAYTKISSINLYFNVYAKMDDTYTKGQVSTTFLQRNMPMGNVIWHRKT
jgi:hypothetical protein